MDPGRGSIDIDIDLYREAAREVAEDEVRRAAAMDIGDWLTFEIRGGRSITNAVRLPIRATIGSTIWVEFHVDLVGSDLRMTGVADKIAATYERHGDDGPSTRYHDLVDLIRTVNGGYGVCPALPGCVTLGDG